jgi:C1A family cysteine protease
MKEKLTKKEKIKQQGRTPHLYTWKKDTIDHRDYILNKTIDTTVLASVPKIDLRLSCPTIYNQGNLGSCVANGTACCIQFGQIKYSFAHQFIPSRLFIYYNTRVIENSVNSDSGTTIRDALISVNKQGACPETIWPYVTSKFAVKPTNQAYVSGSQHLVKTYTRVIFDLNQMKQCLIDGFPFIFGILLYTSFDNIGSDGLVPVPNKNESLLGGHCMTCVGYDDGLQRFIVRNSWGTNWGDKGYCYIPYSYMSDSNNTFDLWTIRNIVDTEVNLTNIQSVVYGKKNKYVNVTQKFVSYFNSGNTVMSVENRLFGDPYYGVVKELRIIFNNGTILVYPEHSVINASSLTSGGDIIKTSKISKAIYGKNTRFIDVTNIVKNQFSQGYPQIKVSNTLFTDPYPYVVKELQITLTDGTVKTFAESTYVNMTDVC